MEIHTKSPKIVRKQENYNFCLDLNVSSSDIDNYKKTRELLPFFVVVPRSSRGMKTLQISPRFELDSGSALLHLCG